jgi:hypothetical protein
VDNPLLGLRDRQGREEADVRALDSIDGKLNKPEKHRPGNRTPGILDGTPTLNKLLIFLEGDRARSRTGEGVAISGLVETTAGDPAELLAVESDDATVTNVTPSTSSENRIDDLKSVQFVSPVESGIDIVAIDRDSQNEGVDRSLVEFAIQSFGSFPSSSEVVLNFAEFRATETTLSHDPEKPWNIVVAEDNVGTTKARAECPEMRSSEEASTNRERRQFRSPSEIVDMIVRELRAFDDAPKRGFKITVYGANPWNAMLTIGPDAGAVNDPQGWHSRVRDIGVRLRRDFEVVGT